MRPRFIHHITSCVTCPALSAFIFIFTITNPVAVKNINTVAIA